MTKKPHLSPVTISLGGRDWPLVLDFNVLAAIEDQVGKSVLSDDFWQSFPRTAGEVRAMLWAFMAQSDPEITVQSVGKMLSPDAMADVLPALMSARNLGLVTDDAGADDKAGGKKSHRTGKQSGL